MLKKVLSDYKLIPIHVGIVKLKKKVSVANCNLLKL